MYQESNMANWSIANGMTVYASDGEKLGTVRDYYPRATFLDIHKGWLFPKDFFVPTASIASVDDDGIVLNMTRDTLADAQYESPNTFSSVDSTYTDQGSAGAAAATSNVDGLAADRRPTADSNLAESAKSATAAAGEDIRVPLRQEELVIGKERQEEGHVRIHKDVVTEEQTVNVPLQHERVTVERVPYSGGAANTADQFEGRDVDVPVTGEKAVVGKRVSGVEEVLIHKDIDTKPEQVKGTVRKERVTVEGAEDRDQVNVRHSAVDDARDIWDRDTDR